MDAVRIVCQILEDDESVPKGHQFVKCHIMFNIKMEDFCNKARLVAGGHMAEVPPAITYTSMASCETQSIAF